MAKGLKSKAQRAERGGVLGDWMFPSPPATGFGEVL